MESIMKWFSVSVPRGWNDVAVRTLLTAMVGILVLLLKDGLQTGDWDYPAALEDGVSVAAGIFLLYAVLRWPKGD